MNKPKKTMVIKMSAEDVAEAVDLWMNRHQEAGRKNIFAYKVEKTSSKIYFLTAYIK